jgi:hypothetical protein
MSALHVALRADSKTGLRRLQPVSGEIVISAPTSWRSQIRLPTIPKAFVDQAALLADRLAETVDSRLKFDLELSFPRFLRRLKMAGADERLFGNADFLAAVIYRTQVREPYTGGVKGLFQAVLREAGLGKRLFQEVRASLVRFALQLDQPDGVMTPERAEQFQNCARFQRVHKMNQLLDGLTPRQIIDLAYPPEVLNGPPVIRRSMLYNGPELSAAQTERELALVLIDTGVVVVSKGSCRIIPEAFGTVRWGQVLARAGLAEGIKAHPSIQGRARDALAVGARKLGVEALFGAEEGQVPPFAIASRGMWSAEYGGKPMTWYLGRVVVREVRKRYPHLCYTDGPRAGALVPAKAVEVPWSSEITRVADGVIHKQGVSVFDVIAHGDPHFFGVEQDKVLPVEIPVIGVRTVTEMRARLAVGLYRTGLGSILEKEGSLFWKVQLDDAIAWLQGVDATFGKRFIAPIRGTLRLFDGESVGGSLAILFTGSSEVPHIFSTFNRHHIFRAGMTYFLNKLASEGLSIDLCFKRTVPVESERGAAIPPALPQHEVPLVLGDEDVYLYYSRFVVTHNRYPENAEQLSRFIQDEAHHTGPVVFSPESLGITP